MAHSACVRVYTTQGSSPWRLYQPSVRQSSKIMLWLDVGVRRLQNLAPLVEFKVSGMGGIPQATPWRLTGHSPERRGFGALFSVLGRFPSLEECYNLSDPMAGPGLSGGPGTEVRRTSGGCSDSRDS